MRLRALLLALCAALATPALAQLSPAQLAGASARPPADAHLPAALAFTDQTGARVTLGNIAGGRPMVLLFVDYTCRHICAPGVAIVANALAHTGLAGGRDYALVLVGIDPRDGVAAARAMAARRLSLVPATLLTGDKAAIARAIAALGYTAIYDPATDQFAHDASLYVFAADGHLAQVLPELAVTPDMLRAAIVHPPPRPGLLIQAARLCYGFAAAHGIYGRPIVLALRGLAVLVVAGLAAWLGMMRWRSGQGRRA